MARRRYTFAKIGKITEFGANPGVLAVCAVAVIVVTIAWRFYYAAEIPGECGAELEAARRIIGGAKPYTDFYSSDMLPLLLFRLFSLGLMPLSALFSGHCRGFSDALLDLNTNFCDAQILGVCSTLSATLVFLASVFGLHRILSLQAKSSHRWLFLLAFALANLAMGFEFGQQQHIFLLLSAPYLVLRYFQWQSPQKPSPPSWQLFSALAAAFGAAFSLFNLISIFAFEVGEIIARRSLRPLANPATLAFSLMSLTCWSLLLGLDFAQKEALFGWILPLKYLACTHHNFAYYGWGATPERVELIYAFVLSTIFAYGGVLHFPVLRPLVIMASAGLFTWMSLTTGLSGDGLILTFFVVSTASIEFYGLVLYMVRCYPRHLAFISRLFECCALSRQEAAVTAIVLVGALAFAAQLLRAESMQRREIKSLATRLQPPGKYLMADLQKVITANSYPGDRLMIINGNLRPAYPLQARLGRRSCGYFIGTEVLGTLQNLRCFHMYSLDNRDKAMILGTEKMLYKRLLDDIIIYRPSLLCIEGGGGEDSLNLYKLYSPLMRRYKRLGEAMYFSERREPRELSEFNYNYWVYKLDD